MTQTTSTRSKAMAQSLASHADNFGVTIDEDMMEGLQIFFTENLDNDDLMENLHKFFAEIIQGGRGAAAYSEDVVPATLPMVDRLAAALQRFAVDIENGKI